MHDALTPGLVVAHSHRLEDLTEVAVQFTSSYPLPPLTEETVLVQSNGIAQWLKVNLAQAKGIAAMLDVTLPARFVWKAYRAVLGHQVPKVSPFDKDRLTWRIMRVLPELIAANPNGWFTPIKHYTAADTDQRKLYQLSLKLADLFDQYQVYRADWLDNWVLGKNHLDTPQQPLVDDQLWQAELWRVLTNDIGIEDFWNNRAELHRRFVSAARGLTERPAGLPPRIVVFGISSLPQQTFEVIDALKGYTQILLCVHNPSKHFWANIVDGKEALQQALRDARRQGPNESAQRLPFKPGTPEEIEEDRLHHFAQPLLAAWGKQGRDYIHLLDLYDETLVKREEFPAIKFELFDEYHANNLLQQLQDDILNLRPIQETQQHWPALAKTDQSICFHVCHSPQREVEILHDQLLAAFAADENLRPRDVMVMVPDINSYAAHIDAVFNRFQSHQDPRAIPYTIADQGERHQQPLLIALELLLKVDQLRVNQSDLLNLLAVPAVQRRFGLSDSDLPQLQRWFNDAGARWGLSADHRATYKMPRDAETNSWWFAMKRMVFGYVMGDLDAETQQQQQQQQQPWQNIAPYAEVSGLDADLAGKLTQVIRSLERWWTFSQTERPLHDWAQEAENLVAAFFSADAAMAVQDAQDSKDIEQDLQLLGRLNNALAAVIEVSDDAAFTTAVPLVIFREAWLTRIDQPNLNQRFLAGAVNFATLMPMRAIPFKQLFILGMNEGEYPRSQPRLDFDLMIDHYRPGDRSRRDDDRYLFLEALLSARDRFYVSWIGHSARDNSELTASVLVAQLREHLEAGWRTESGAAVLEQLTHTHKLQPFSLDYMQADSALFTYASEWVAARNLANTSAEQGSEAPPTASPMATEQVLQVSIRDLRNFMQEPAQLFFNRQLDTYFGDDDNPAQDSETFSLQGLPSWSIQQRLLKAGQRNPEAIEDVLVQNLDQLQREGALGVGPVAAQLRNDSFDEASAILEGFRSFLAHYPERLPVQEISYQSQQCQLQDAIGSVYENQVHERAQVVLIPTKIHASANSIDRSKWKHLLQPYIRHLLLNAKQPTRTLIISRDNQQLELARITESAQATAALDALLHWVNTGVAQPLALEVRLAMNWLHRYRSNLSGSVPKKDGTQSQRPMSLEDAQNAADAELNQYEVAEFNSVAIRDDARYCGRICRDAKTMRAQPQFMPLLEAVYAPLLSLLPPSQQFAMGLPQPLYDTDASSDGNTGESAS